MANNLTSIAKTLLSSDALKGISKQTGVATEDVSSILSSALPSLLNGANKQATTKSTAEGFLEALQTHGANDTSNLTSFLKNVDIEDGSKIIKHLLGSETKTVAKDVAKTTKSNVKAEDVSNVLAVAAPLVMSLIGKQTTSKKNKDTSTALSSITSLLGNKEVKSLATSLLGNKTSKKKDDSIDLGSVINIASKFLK